MTRQGGGRRPQCLYLCCDGVVCHAFLCACRLTCHSQQRRCQTTAFSGLRGFHSLPQSVLAANQWIGISPSQQVICCLEIRSTVLTTNLCNNLNITRCHCAANLVGLSFCVHMCNSELILYSTSSVCWGVVLSSCVSESLCETVEDAIISRSVGAICPTNSVLRPTGHTRSFSLIARSVTEPSSESLAKQQWGFTARQSCIMGDC